MRRALRWDGLIPQVLDDDGARHPDLDETAALRKQIDAEVTRPPDSTSSSRASIADHSPAA